MSQIVFLLSLGLLMLWVLSPVATLIASQFPRYRKRLGLEPSITRPKPSR